MRPTWLFCSVLLHTAAIGAAAGAGLYASRRGAPPRPRVEVMASAASAPAAPATAELPPLAAEPADEAAALAPDPLLAEPLRAADPPPVADVLPASAPLSLVRVRKAAPVEAEPVPVAEPPAPARARVDARPCADNEPPVFPAAERARGHVGTVVLAVDVDRRGFVTDVSLRVPSRHAGLNREALRAVRRWRFEPAVQHGVAVDCTTEVSVEFRLQDR